MSTLEDKIVPSGVESDSENTGDVEKTPVDVAPAPPPNFSDAPDGGLAAWLVVVGAWCTAFCSFGWINSVGTFQEYYENGPLSNYSASTVAWITSLEIFFMSAMGPVVGQLFDRYGPRSVILAGTLLHVFGLMMASISTKYYQLLLSQGVCSAIGVSAVFQPALACLPGWFNRRRGAAYGIVATGSSIGGVIFPIMVSRLIDSVGFGWAMRASAFMILGLLIIANLTVHSRSHGKGYGRAPARPPQPPLALRPLLHPRFVTLMAGMFLLTFGIYIPVTFLSVQALETGNVTKELAQYLLAMLNAGSLAGRLLSGFAADRIGKYNSFLISCTCSGIVVLGLWIPGTSRDAIIAFAVLFGFFSGAYVGLLPSLVAQISPPQEIGFRTGILFLTCAVPGLVTSPVAGAILEHGGWVGVKVFAGVFFLAGVAMVSVTRVLLVGWKLFAVC